MTAAAEKAKIMPEQPVFVLDIGTHSVIGIVGEMKKGVFTVRAVEERAHTTRSMLDGQIQDIEAVAEVAAAVHKKLQGRLRRPLTWVSVAAAGRTLLTQVGRWEETLEPAAPVSPALVARLENGAVAQAHEAALEKAAAHNTGPFVCVGYSVTKYLLDDYPISVLKGHTGTRASAEVIATFLPQQVVDSLKTAMERVGLEVELLTLEPIAAMNAVIPPQLRMLNLALVDIGAGTSDMAISTSGSISAYTMATIAGDEVTEALSAHLLVDFREAEQLKLAAAAGEDAQFTDIMGRTRTASPEELRQAMLPAVTQLAQAIAARILENNGQRPPSAVFLVGGGSQAPGLAPMVAKELGLPEDRVAVGGSEYQKKLAVFPKGTAGSDPRFATPLGIALTTAQAREEGRIAVQLNGQAMSLSKTGNCRVMDVLAQAGFGQDQLLAPKGKDVRVTADGEEVLFRGKAGMPASILCNGAPIALSAPLKNGDRLEFSPAQRGEDAAPAAVDVYGGDVFFTVRAGEKELPAGMGLRINGEPAQPQQKLRDGDRLESFSLKTLRELGLEGTWMRNASLCGPDEPLEPGDRLEQPPQPQPQPRQKPQPSSPPPQPAPAEETAEMGIEIMLNGRTLSLPVKADGTPYAFFDLLPYADIDPRNPQGIVELKLNGRQAAYLDTLHSGDHAEIGWKR
ncbi:MAG: cell division FtsA domain-containing protein [Oscillospiraceae bacterium]|nr:cell division FtsA domain-containing protein [Oscillospiraceae bacterium]